MGRGLKRAPSGHPLRPRPSPPSPELQSVWVAGGGAEVTAGWGGLEGSPANTATIPTNFRVRRGGAKSLRSIDRGNYF